MRIEHVFSCPPSDSINGQQVCCLADTLSPTTRTTAVTQAASSTLIINEIMAMNPRVVAFGEIHPERGAVYTPTVARFTREILPSLSRGGIQDLVLEAIPNDPIVEQELNLFFRTGHLNSRQTPQLMQSIQGVDMSSYIQLLYTCRTLGIRIHGGGANIAQAEATIRRSDYLERRDLSTLAARYIRDNTLQAANRLLDQGRRIAIYSGHIHNNRFPTQAEIDRGTNFGVSLSQRMQREGNRYFEVDLILPYRQHHIPIPNWRSLLPRSGVTAIRRGNSYSLLYPRDYL
jgi:hypothetical protein